MFESGLRFAVELHASASRVSAAANRLRQGYGGPPKLYAKAEASALRRIEKAAGTDAIDAARCRSMKSRTSRETLVSAVPTDSSCDTWSCPRLCL